MFYSHYLHDFISGNNYNNNLSPGLEKIWDQYNVTNLRHLVSDLTLNQSAFPVREVVGDDNWPEYMPSQHSYSSYKILNESDENIVTLNEYGLYVRHEATGLHKGVKLRIEIDVRNVRNITLAKKTNWKASGENIDLLLTAVIAMHIEFMKSRKLITGEDVLSMRLGFTIDLMYFIKRARNGILYIAGLKSFVGLDTGHIDANINFVDALEDKAQVRTWFDPYVESWFYAYVVNNTTTIPVVWTKVHGEVVKVNTRLNSTCPDGLYVYTSEAFINNSEPHYYSLDDLENNNAAVRGFSIIKEDVEAGKCNKVYIDLENQYKKQLEEAEKENEKLTARVEAILKDIDKIEKEKEKLRHEERIKAFEMQRLKDQVERSKSESGFRFTGLVITVITGIIGIFASLKKIFSK